MQPLSRLAASVVLALALTLTLAACSPAAAPTSTPDSPVPSGLSPSTAIPSASALTRTDFATTGDKLKVMTTVSPLTNIALNIGGNRIALYGLIPDGVDSHTFEPKPSDAKVMSRADLIVINGAHLEGNIKDMVQANMKQGAHLYELADATITTGDDPQTGFLYDFSFPRAQGDPNPHLWMDPLYAGRYAELFSQWFSQADPRNADYYRANYLAFKTRIDDLDQRIRQAVATISEKDRKLLTYHDAYAYFAREYGMQVIGAIQPSDFGEPSAQEVARLIDQIKAVGVPAVFGSEVYPSKVTQQIARETGATYIDTMRDDEPPGPEDAPQHTYLGMMAEDMKALVSALGGNPDIFTGFQVTNTYRR